MSFPPPTPKQARVLWFALTALAVAVLLTLIGLLIWGVGLVLDRLSAVLVPLALALVLAYILDPVVEYFVRKKMPRRRAVLLVFLLGFLAVTAVACSVVPGIVVEVRELVNTLPKDVDKFQKKFMDFKAHSPVASRLLAVWDISMQTQNPQAAAPTNSVPMTISGTTNSAPAAANAVPTLKLPSGAPVMSGLANILLAVAHWLGAQLGKVTVWMGFAIGFFLVPIYLFYFLLEKQAINDHWTKYLPLHESKAKDELVFVLKSINDSMVVFFRGQVLVALCVGVLLTIGYLILGLNYAVLLGVVAAILGVVPYLGTITCLALALMAAAVQFGDWLHPLIVLCIAIVVKMLEDFLISPKIMGERSGLHPMAIIVAVLAGTTLFGGFLGALLAIPVTAVLRTLMFRYVWKKR